MNNSIAISLRGIAKNYQFWQGKGWLAKLGRGLTRSSTGGSMKNFYALHEISFEVQAGECIGVIGRNGSGKSTLLQVLAGIVKPTAGEGCVHGEIAALLELGTGFHGDFTGRENVGLHNAMLGLSPSEAKERFARIAAFAELGKFMDEPIRTYSSGMLLRLGFACAVAVEPDVLIVDEALAVGDIFFQQKCYDHMRQAMKDKTRVIVSHDMRVITSFCNRVLVLEQGRIAFDGPPLEAVEHYLKALHNEAGQEPTAFGSPAKKNVNTVSAPVKPAKWKAVDGESLGGIQELRFSRVEVAVNGIAWASIVKPDDLVCIRAKVDCDESKVEVLFGYLVRDKMGNAVFGENTASIVNGIIEGEAGELEIAFDFRWPEIQPADYFLTLGIGEGSHPIDHRIQCWAHNVAVFSAISPLKPVHCLFNNPIHHFAVQSSARTELTQI